ncbi:glycoside hydrolase family 3 N-terminal domain-containing protein [Natronoarchaeum philippinense]|nr:glycoside hydrolase family 3 N-terminal domain-containing protein [Natronoarchaeum philippinense]
MMQACASDEERAEIDRKVESLLEEMTLDEKVGQLNQYNGSEQTGPAVEDVDVEAEIRDGRVGSILNASGLESHVEYQQLAVEESRLGIPLLFGYDVVHGYETLFPIPLGEAASWNPGAAKEAASIAAAEAAADGYHWSFGPPVDVTRDARWGRAMETSGEDPHLGSELAAARVEGFQGDDLAATDTVLACAKHYAAYGEVKAGREYNTVDISESTLRDIHLPPFEAAVDAGVGTVMNAFTDYDGVPAGASEHLVRDVLKGEMGFDGFVVSDWNSFRELIYHGVAADEREAAERAMMGGSDMDMVGHIYNHELADLVDDGVVPEAYLDEAVRRVLRTKYLLGLFEDPYKYFDEDRREETIRADAHHETARDVARESIVLMDNDDAVLPLDSPDEIAVVGGLADSADDVLGDWRARGHPDYAVSVLDGITEAAGDGIDVTYAKGCERTGESSEQLRQDAVDAVADADVAVVAVGETWELSGECSSRTDIGLPGEQRKLLEALVETDTPVTAVLMNGRPLAVPWLAENVPAILETWFLGSQAGNAIADVLFGEYNPSGKLPITFPRSLGQVPIHYNHPPTGRPKEQAEPGWGTSYLDEANDPLYAFGHGLSYTSFAYTDLELSADAVDMDERLQVQVTVENGGSVAGEEVVQLYVHDLVGSRTRPVKELKGFEKIELEPGERRTVEFELESDDLAFWTLDEEFAAEPGEFRVMAGSASDDIRCADSFELVE